MAQQLKDSISSAVYSNKALCHIHRCQQTHGVVELTTKINPFITNLQVLKQASEQARLDQYDTNDDLIFNDGGMAVFEPFQML